MPTTLATPNVPPKNLAKILVVPTNKLASLPAGVTIGKYHCCKTGFWLDQSINEFTIVST